MYGIDNPLPPVPLSEGDKGGRGLGGCNITQENTQPPESPFFNGDLNEIT